MAKKSIGIVDIVTNASSRSIYARTFTVNSASIMPQAIAAWCEQDGHDVTYLTFTGLENLLEELPDTVDLVFIGAFSPSAELAYAMSNLFRSRSAVTVLGGPHARAYPANSQKYFDYVVGLADRDVIRDVVRECAPSRPLGVRVTADRQPTELPSVRERWKFIEQNFRKTPIGLVPMLGSTGCPYTCSFCIDAAIPYQTMDYDVMKEDLRFVRENMRKPLVGWHDPNFGVRMSEYLDVIEEAVPPGSVDFLAESSLSLLSEPNLKRLGKNGFVHMAPGIESWYSYGNKSKTKAISGQEKVERVAEHINLIQQYIPSVDANLVLGLDSDSGPEPFELSRQFIDRAPGMYPGIYLLTAFGSSARINFDYVKDDRYIPFPFHFLNTIKATNVVPKHYTWPEYYDNVLSVFRRAYSWRSLARRFASTRTSTRWLNLIRGATGEGRWRLQFIEQVRRRLEDDPQVRAYFDRKTTKLPSWYVNRVRRDMGVFWEWLPDGALYHDPELEFASTTPSRPSAAGAKAGRRVGGASMQPNA